MRHIFIINPAAGKKDGRQRVYAMAEKLKREHDLDVECMLTKSRGHATALTRAIAETGDYVRFYACGGDGTVNEIANGIAGFPNAAMTCIPIGTGNDFLKNFGKDAEPLFLDAENLWNGDVTPLDLIDCNGKYCLTIACTGIDARIAELKASGLGADVVSHPISRPDYLEAEAVSRLLRIAQAADAPVIIVHTTNRASLAEIAAARRRGQTVYVETCPQYLALDDGVYYDPDFSSAARYVCAPPIRSQEDCEALWKALRRGEVQTISTDHCSFTLEQKDMGREDFTKIPGGLPGVETRGEVIYTIAENENKLSLAGVCRALSENPAKLYGLFPRKGVIAPGSDADIVVYDPGASHVLHGAELLSKAGYTPFEGFRTNGGVSKVYLRGTLQVDGGKVIGGKTGEYLKRGKCAL